MITHQNEITTSRIAYRTPNVITSKMIWRYYHGAKSKVNNPAHFTLSNKTAFDTTFEATIITISCALAKEFTNSYDLNSMDVLGGIEGDEIELHMEFNTDTNAVFMNMIRDHHYILFALYIYC